MNQLCQLYDNQGRPMPGAGGTKDDIFGKGLLHGASHVWMWRKSTSGVEILLQKRAANKLTWPNCYDISAAGHIDLGETPLEAALRETNEEVGLTIPEENLRNIGVYKAHMVAPNGAIENEFQWLYTLEILEQTNFTLQQSEVSSLEWKSLDDFAKAVESDPESYVQHGSVYYNTIIGAIKQQY